MPLRLHKGFEFGGSGKGVRGAGPPVAAQVRNKDILYTLSIPDRGGISSGLRQGYPADYGKKTRSIAGLLTAHSLDINAANPGPKISQLGKQFRHR